MDPTIPQTRNDNSQSSGLGNTNTHSGTQDPFPLFKNPDVTRHKIVEILSNTANGCLSELGYLPGMTVRMQELEDLCAQQDKDIKKMKYEQRKLFEDNVKLNSLAQTQASRLKDIGLTEIEKASRLAKLEEEVQRLRAQKTELVQGRKLQEAGGKEVESSFTQLQIKHMDLLESYRLAYAEVQRLHSQIKSQEEELASVKTQLNTVISQQNGSQPQTVQQVRQQQPQPAQRSAHPQQPQFHNMQRPVPQPLMIPPSHPQYNQIFSVHLSQQNDLVQQQSQPMPQTVSPSQLYFSQQGFSNRQQKPTFYPTQASSASSPIILSPDVHQRQPSIQQSATVQQQMQVLQMQRHQQQQQQLGRGPEPRTHSRRASDISAMPQQLMQSDRPQPQQQYQPSVFNNQPSTSGQAQQMFQDPSLVHGNQHRNSIRRSSFSVPSSQPSLFSQQHAQLMQQPSFTHMGPPTQFPPQYNPVQTHRANASPEALPWSAPSSVPIYRPSGTPNQASPQGLHPTSMSNGGEPLSTRGDPQRQSRSVPTTPTQGFSEPFQSIMSGRTQKPTSRPSSSTSSSPRGFLPPPPTDESTIIFPNSLNYRTSVAPSSSSSSRPGSRQQSVTLPSPSITQLRRILPIPPTVIGSNEASSGHPVEDSERPVAHSLMHDAGPQRQTPTAFTALATPIHMKRESSTSASELRRLSEDSDQVKRIRVDTESRSPPAEPPSQSQPVVTPVPALPVDPPPTPPVASPPEVFVKGEPMDDVPMLNIPLGSDYNGSDVQMGTEDDVIVIEEEEVGSDGLRLVSNCLPDVYDIVVNEDGSISNTCKLCLHRYSRQVVSEPPPPFINATDEELEKHCLDDHESVWMKVRDPS